MKSKGGRKIANPEKEIVKQERVDPRESIFIPSKKDNFCHALLAVAMKYLSC